MGLLGRGERKRDVTEGEFCDGEGMRCEIRLQDGETMASLCRESGSSRKDRLQRLERYQECGRDGLSDRFFNIDSSMRCDYSLEGFLSRVPTLT